MMEALCEGFAEKQWVQIKEDERDYILEAFRADVDMPDQSDSDDEESVHSQERAQSGIAVLSNSGTNNKGNSDNDSSKELSDSGVSYSALAVGCKSDRSFVVRGDKIGVFADTNSDNLGKILLPVLDKYHWDEARQGTKRDIPY